MTPAPGPHRRLRVGVSHEAVLVTEKVFDPGADVTIGGDESAALVVAGWTGPTLLLISGRDLLLHLQPGMRLIMCDDDGGDRVVGTFAELSARGLNSPIRITENRRLNVSVREGITVLAHFLPEDAPTPGEARQVP